MAKVITFNTNSNNQFTIITIFKTKFLSNITTTRSIVSSFIYFPNSTTTQKNNYKKIGKLYTASMLMDLKSINLLKNVKRMPYTMKL